MAQTAIETTSNHNHPANVGLFRVMTRVAEACDVRTQVSVRFSFQATDVHPVRARPAHTPDELGHLAAHPPHRPIQVRGLSSRLVKGRLAPGKQACLAARLNEGWDSQYDEISMGDREAKLVVLVEFPAVPPR